MNNVSLFEHFPPLFLLTFVFIAGITWQALCLPFIIPAVCMVGILLVCLPYNPHYFSRLGVVIPLALSAFLLGGWRYSVHTHYFLEQAQQLCKQNLNITGTIVDQESTPYKRFKQSLTVAVCTATHFEKNITFYKNSLIKLSLTKDIPCTPGDQIQINNLYLHSPENNSYGLFLHKQGIIATGYVGKKSTVTVIPQPPSATQLLYTKKAGLLQQFKQLLSPTTFTLFASIFLGYKTPQDSINSTIKEQFSWWGISHYLARSGLHLVMFVIVLQFLLLWIPLPLYIKDGIAAACIGIYTLLSWSSVSFMRALLTVTLYFICTFSRIPTHTLHVIALVCTTILLYNPLYLFSLDFQLSFSLALALALLRDATLFRRQQITPNS